MAQRTPKQNNSVHKSFREFADDFKAAGITKRKMLTAGLLQLDLPPTEHDIKEIFRAIMLEQHPHGPTDKEGNITPWIDPDNPSTTELSTVQLSECWETMNAAFAEKYGISRVFPCMDALYFEAVYK